MDIFYAFFLEVQSCFDIAHCSIDPLSVQKKGIRLPKKTNKLWYKMPIIAG
jgi:hypothetical protein